MTYLYLLLGEELCLEPYKPAYGIADHSVYTGLMFFFIRFRAIKRYQKHDKKLNTYTQRRTSQYKPSHQSSTLDPDVQNETN